MSVVHLNTPFKWTTDQNSSFEKLKVLITEKPNLRIFDSKCVIEIQTDASQFGIWDCLLQQRQPVAFCSRSLTEAETLYPQIDKELLAICFAWINLKTLFMAGKLLLKQITFVVKIFIKLAVGYKD